MKYKKLFDKLKPGCLITFINSDDNHSLCAGIVLKQDKHSVTIHWFKLPGNYHTRHTRYTRIRYVKTGLNRFDESWTIHNTNH